MNGKRKKYGHVHAMASNGEETMRIPQQVRENPRVDNNDSNNNNNNDNNNKNDKDNNNDNNDSD